MRRNKASLNLSGSGELVCARGTLVQAPENSNTTMHTSLAEANVPTPENAFKPIVEVSETLLTKAMNALEISEKEERPKDKIMWS